MNSTNQTENSKSQQNGKKTSSQQRRQIRIQQTTIPLEYSSKQNGQSFLQQANLAFDAFNSSVQMNREQHDALNIEQQQNEIVLNKDLEDTIDLVEDDKRDGAAVADREQTISDISSLSIDADK